MTDLTEEEFGMSQADLLRALLAERFGHAPKHLRGVDEAQVVALPVAAARAGSTKGAA